MREVLVERQGAPSRRTVVHWATVFLLSISGLLTVLTSIYFLALPSGGYQGGRNHHYGDAFLFDRHIWTDIHTWAGIVMVAVAVFHIVLHWQWVAEMAKRSVAIAMGKRKSFHRKIWLRVGVVTVVGLVFLGVAASGIYFFVLPGEGGANKAVQFLFGRSTWDLIHTWMGIVMVVAGIVHLAQRWKWVVRVTQGVARSSAGHLPVKRPSSAVASIARREGLPEGRTL